MVKAKKTYKAGGKVVAQGADKKDVRREKKMDRVVARAAKKAARSAKKAKRVGDRNFKRDVKSGRLVRLGTSSAYREMPPAAAKAGSKKKKS